MYTTMMKVAPVALLAAVLMQPAHAGERRVLPELALVDSTGVAVDSAALRQSGRWLLLVVDAGMASSQSLLSTLARKPDGYEGRLVVIVAGAPAPAHAFIAANEKLPGVRWLLDPARQSGVALHLSVTPVLLALDDNNQVGWQLSGQPGRSTVGTMVAQWLKPAPGTK